MWKFLTLLLLVQVISRPVMSQPEGVRIKLLNDKSKELQAGSTSNVLVMLSNNSDTVWEIQLKLITPENWKQINDYSSVRLEGNSTTPKILSFYVPESTRVGNYQIDVEALNKPENSFIGKVSIPIRIKPVYKIRIEKFKAPAYLLSGDTLGVNFLIQNLSNTGIHITAEIINGKTAETRNISIPVDNEVIESIQVTIPQNLPLYTQYHVSIKASMDERAGESESSSYSFDIIPANQTKFDGFNRIPVRISGMVASHNKSGKRVYGTMFDIRGGGLLSENKKRTIDFHLRGPDRGGNPLLGLNDEYYLRYYSSSTEIVLGDYNYRLSDLTESSRSGRGIGARYLYKKLSMGSFFHFPRYFPGIRQILSVYSDYKFNENFRVVVGYLTKIFKAQNPAHLFTLGSFVQPFPWINGEIEVATGMQLGKLTKAFKTSLKINFPKFRSHFIYTESDRNFPGYISNSQYLSSGISLNMNKKLHVALNYDLNHTNQALDSLFSNAPFSNNISAQTGLRINSNHSVLAGFHVIEREDRSDHPLFYYRKYLGRISFQNRWGNLSLNLQGELGKMVNFLSTSEGDLTDTYKVYFSLRYLFGKSISIESFINYQGGQQYLVDGFHRFYYGGAIRASLKGKTYLTLDYQNNYEVEEYYRDRSLLTFRIHQKIFNNHEVEINTNYNLVKNSLDKTELSFLVRYTYTLQVPVSRKTDMGRLSGKVVNMGVDGVEGIMFNLNGNIAITDHNGEFSIPFVKTGTWYLLMDESSAGIRAIANVPGPYQVIIEPGQETHFEIQLTKSASIKGRLVIEEDMNAGKKGFYPVKEEVRSLVLEASNGPEMFRLLSSSDGSFTFNDLRTGVWRVKVYPNGIPKGYKLTKDHFEIDLSSGEVKELDVIIHKKSREIKFQRQ